MLVFPMFSRGFTRYRDTTQCWQDLQTKMEWEVNMTWITARQFWLLMHLMASLGAARRACAAMASVITGTWAVDPWYRGAAPPGVELAAYPRRWRLASSHLAGWHTFVMQWKEH